MKLMFDLGIVGVQLVHRMDGFHFRVQTITAWNQYETKYQLAEAWEAEEFMFRRSKGL